MTPIPSGRERWPEIEAALDRLLEAEPEARAELLGRIEAGNPTLHRELASLLRAADAAGGMLDQPALALASSFFSLPSGQAGPDLTGAVFGPWRLVREVGHGGMGVVYLAERADGGFQQQAALKLLDVGRGSADLVARFARERQILARLDHPHIARLLDGGETPEGQPWFAMEFVDGDRITAWCDRHCLGLAARLALFEQVCDAVRYAHRNLVVHRDIKPSNILVRKDGGVRLLDFGIAKLLAEAGEGRDDQTRTGLWVMTPEYGAPEQVRGEPVTTATDVYALGTVLYELVSGHRAHRFSRFTPAEVDRVICDVEPEPPSVVAGRMCERHHRDGRIDRSTPEEMAAARATTPERLHQALQGDLDTIVLACLRKDPARRYGSADALLEDLGRWREGRPIAARQDAVGYRVGKFVRRHRVGVAAALALVLALLGGLGATLWQAGLARQEARRARAVTDFLVGIFRVADPATSQGRDVPASELLARGVAGLDSSLATEPRVRAELLGVLGTIHRELGLYERADSLLQHAVLLARETRGPRDTVVGTRLTERATVLKALGRYAGAESLLAEAIAIREARLGSGHPLVATALGELAAAHHGMGNDSLAEREYRRVIAIDERHFGPRSLEVATDYNNLVSMLDDVGRFAEADSLVRIALAIQLEHLDSASPTVLTTLHNLGAVRASLGEDDEAERIKRRVLELRQGIHPPDHPEIAYAQHSLASTLESLGRYVEAESLYLGAVAIRTAALGRRNELTMGTLNNLGTLRYRRGDLAGAESVMREVVEAWTEHLGSDHPRTLTARNNLGVILREAGRFAEAEPLLLAALEGRRRRFGSDHPDVAASWRNVGLLYLRTGRRREAVGPLEEAVRIFEATFGSDDRRTVDARQALRGIAPR